MMLKMGLEDGLENARYLSSLSAELAEFPALPVDMLLPPWSTERPGGPGGGVNGGMRPAADRRQDTRDRREKAGV